MGYAWKEIEKETSGGILKLVERANEDFERIIESPENHDVTIRYGFVVDERRLEAHESPITQKVEVARARIRKIGDYGEELKHTLDGLLSSGLRPQAILPGALWNGLCHKFSLMRFENLTEEGYTGIAEQNDIHSKAFIAGSIAVLGVSMLLGLLFFVLTSAFCLVAGVFSLYYDDWKVQGKITHYDDVFIFSLIASILSGGASAASIVPEPYAIPFFGIGIMAMVGLFYFYDDKIFPKVMRTIPTSLLIKLIWPGGADHPINPGANADERVKVAFKVQTPSGFYRIA